MATLAEMKAAIADDIDDTSGEYASQIATAITRAIAYCERATYYFNETRDLTFSTVASQSLYDSSDLADIATLVRLQAAYVTDTGGQIHALDRIDPKQMEILQDSSASSGEPTCFSYFASALRLYPVPDQAYTVRLQAGPYRLAALSGDSDSNVWTTEAYDLVKARAKYILAKDTLKDVAMATEAINDYLDQHAALKAETASRTGTGYIRPTCF